ncbi:MAG: DUF4240 domain-containing protein [Pirellulales bacterium]
MPDRRWFQFRLKWLLIFVTLLAVPLSWLGWKLEEKRREQWAEAELDKFCVIMSHNYIDDPFADSVPPGPRWLRRLLGDDFFVHATAVKFVPPKFARRANSGPPINDDGLELLRHLPALEKVFLAKSQVTDRGLRHIRGLKKLKYLDLRDTKISGEALAKLLQALPNCEIRHETRANMDMKHFWSIVDRACRPILYGGDQWDERLVAELSKLEPEEIIAWNHIFDELAARAYTADLWGAAYVINGGASDDGFYYFRCWLIGMGKDVYESALANPDSLSDVVDPKVDAEAEIYAAAHQAWLAVTGKSYDDPYPARNEEAQLQGEPWDYEDDDEVRRRSPRLAAMYLK